MTVSRGTVDNTKSANMAIIPTEYQECCLFWDWTQLIPSIRHLTVHFVNEGKRSLNYGRRLKRIGGLPKGMVDYLIFKPNDKYHSLAIEMKTKDERNKKQRKEQLEWIERLNSTGFYAIMCFGCENAIQVTKAYLDNKL